MNDAVRDPVSAATIAQRNAADPAASAWVSANAGTGKTKVLIDRLLGLLLAGTPPGRVLCLTFTKAAAAEMATRIAEILGAWTIIDEARLDKELFDLLGRQTDEATRRRARTLFARVLDAPGGMHIETIHAFCQSVLRRFPLEARVAPHFAVIDEHAANQMMADAREEVLAEARRGGPLAEALAVATALVGEKEFAELMRTLAAERGRLERMLAARGGVAAAARAVRRRLGIGDGETPETVLAAACADGAFDRVALGRAAAALGQGSKTDGERAEVLRRWLADTAEGRAGRFADYARIFITTDSDEPLPRPKTDSHLATKKARTEDPAVLDTMRAEAERIAGAVLKRRAATVAQASAALLVLGGALLDSYRRHKEAGALLDYDDLIRKTRELLRPGRAPWVLYKLDGGIDHLLIDEAQDTNPDQWAVVEALTDDFFAGEGAREAARTVFAVGDVKQSIYGFQGAEPREFGRLCDHYAGRARAAGAGWRDVPLTVSFRSTRAVLGAVDAVFARPEARAGVAFDGSPITHVAKRAGAAGLVEVWPAVAPRASDADEAWKPPVEQESGELPSTRLARLLARRISRMTAGGETLEARGRPICPGDVMVLVRRRGDFVADLVRELKRENVAVAGVDRMRLLEQMAVMDLMALGRFLLLPADDLTLATVLKGPFVGLDDDRLFRLAWNRPGSLWRALNEQAAADSVFAAARETLAGLRAQADFTPPFELYARLLGAGRGRERMLARLGHEAEDPIDEFLNLALAYERDHVPSLEGFLHWLETGEVEVKRDLEQGGRGAVRVITVHGAKGLQAPIVFLPDTLQMPALPVRLMWPADREGELPLWVPRREFHETVAETERARLVGHREEEYRRLLYVAMTRAEDRLYVCGWRTKNNRDPDDCWYNLVVDALQGAPGVERIEEPFLAAAGETEGATVLRLVCRQDGEIEAEERAPEEGVEAGPLPPFALAPPPPEPAPPRPLVPSRLPDEEPPVRSPLGPDDGARFRRGRLIHRLLQTLPDLPPERRDGAAQTFLARPGLGLEPAAREQIAAEALAVLADSRFAALFGPGSRAEVPIAGLVAGQAVSAQVDRLLIGPDEVVVADFKTNRTPPSRPEEVPPAYLRQMAAYRAVLAAVYPDRPVTCILVWTDGPSLMPLPPALLDAHAP